MSLKTRAKLVLMEPGAHGTSAVTASAELNHVLLLGADESLSGFRDRVRRRAASLRLESQALCDVTYLVGRHEQADWGARQSLLADVCGVLEPKGLVAVHAPSSARGDLLGCLGDLQSTMARGLELRAVFTDAVTAA
jgi:hypothetical protein